MPRKKTKEEKTVAAVPVIKATEKAASVTGKPKRKYTRKTAVKEAAPEVDKKIAAAEPVKEVPAPIIKTEIKNKNTSAKEDKPKRKYTRKNVSTKTEKKNDTSSASTSSFILQYGGAEYDIERIKEAVAADSKGRIRGKIKSFDIYVKPEERAVYYVINGKDSFRIDLQ